MGKTGPIKIFFVFHCNQAQTPKRLSSLIQLKSMPLKDFFSCLHIYPLLFAKRFFSTILQKILLHTCFYGTRFPSVLRMCFFSCMNPQFQVTKVNLHSFTFSVYLTLLRGRFLDHRVSYRFSQHRIISN